MRERACILVTCGGGGGIMSHFSCSVIKPQLTHHWCRTLGLWNCHWCSRKVKVSNFLNHNVAEIPMLAHAGRLSHLGVCLFFLPQWQAAVYPKRLSVHKCAILPTKTVTVNMPALRFITVRLNNRERENRQITILYLEYSSCICKHDEECIPVELFTFEGV